MTQSELPPPTFEIQSLLGEGGMAQVHRALMRQGGHVETVALKRMLNRSVERADLLALFEREAKICSMLRHENIVALRAFGHDEAGPYLALEYIDGPTASRLVKAWAAAATPAPLLAALRIAREVAVGLAAAHGYDFGDGRRGLVHRDVSLDNVLVARDGTVKLSDFGVAKLLDSTLVTRTGTVKGKLGHIAPEVFEGEEADGRSDVFSFAVSVFQLLTGVAPFRGTTEAQLIGSVLHLVPPLVTTLRQDIPEPVALWIDRALKKKRDERVATLEEFISLVDAWVATQHDDAKAAVGAWVTQFETTATRESPAPAGEERPKTQLARVPALAPARRASGGVLWGGVLLCLVLGGWSVMRVLAPRESPPVTDQAPPLDVAVAKAPPLSTGDVASPPERPAEPAPPTPAASEAAPKVEAPVGSPAGPDVPTTPPNRTARATGTLRFRIRPWARVFVNGELVGTTPLPPLKLAPGRYPVLLVNEELGVRKSEEVTIEARKETEVRRVFGP